MQVIELESDQRVLMRPQQHIHLMHPQQHLP